MSEQLNLFGAGEEPFEDWLKGILYEVLDRNSTEYKHLVIRKNKGYWAVLYRNVTVFTYRFAGKKKWVNIPLRYSHHLPADIQTEPKEGVVSVPVDGPDQAKQLSEVYAAALDDAIDNGPREYSCCSRYQQCSDAGHCVNPHPDISIECRYKINLKHGRNYFKREA